MPGPRAVEGSQNHLKEKCIQSLYICVNGPTICKVIICDISNIKRRDIAINESSFCMQLKFI